MDTIKIIPKNSKSVKDEKGNITHTLIEVEDLSKVSDGYHTIQELYEHRTALFLAICRILVTWNEVDSGSFPLPWKSKNHSDGSSIKGWFILGIGEEKGGQISYHIPESRWEDLSFVETLEKAPEFDGHTSADVLNRLGNFLCNYTNMKTEKSQ